MKVLSKLDQYFRDISDQRIEIERRLEFLVEKVHEAVCWESYRTAREELTDKLGVEDVKKPIKDRLERVTGKIQGCYYYNGDIGQEEMMSLNIG